MNRPWLHLGMLSAVVATAVGWAISHPTPPPTLSIGGNSMGGTWSVKVATAALSATSSPSFRPF